MVSQVEQPLRSFTGWQRLITSLTSLCPGCGIFFCEFWTGLCFIFEGSAAWKLYKNFRTLSDVSGLKQAIGVTQMGPFLDHFWPQNPPPTRLAETLAEEVIDGRALRHAFESLDDDGSEQVEPNSAPVEGQEFKKAVVLIKGSLGI